MALTRKEIDERWRKAHPEQHREKVRKWAATNPEQHHARNKKWEQEHPEQHLETRRKAYVKLRAKRRQEAIIALGGVCLTCQCVDVRCLQIDHIIPIKGKRMNDTTFYNSIIRGMIENLQVLCANCHAIKTYENGESR
jgi:hypothetical protein